MQAFALILLALVALAAAKHVPTLVVLGVVTAVAAVLRHQTLDVSRQLLAMPRPADGWAAPTRDARRALQKSLRLAIARTELESCFPGRGL